MSERGRTGRLLRLVAFAALGTCLWGLGGAPAGSSRIASSKLRIVAANLNNPRKIFLADKGTIYVAEAGIGGHDRCVATHPERSCVGLSGSITRIVNGAQRRVVTGLVSVAYPNGERAAGPAAVVVRGGRYYILLQDAFLKSNGANVLGADGATAGDLISSPAGKATPRVIASLAAFEATHNPDHGAGPGTKFGNPPIDSDPYGFVAYRGGFAVVDAAANDLLWISPRALVSLVAVFPTQTEKLTAAERKLFRISSKTSSIAAQAVPTCVVVGPEGALFVGELTGLPFTPGTARIWRIVPGKQPTLYASGFTNISDLAFDGRDLLVLEIAAKGLADRMSPGALIRLAPDGKRTVLATAGLVAPTGLAVGNGFIYISNYGTSPGTGAGPHGEVLQLVG